jgi:hypothetical protein
MSLLIANFFIDSYVMSAGHRLLTIDRSSSQPAIHIIEISNVATLPYAMSFKAEIQGASLMYNGGRVWNSAIIDIRPSETVLQEHPLRIIAPGTAILHFRSAEVRAHSGRVRRIYEGSGFSTTIQVV